MAAEESTQVWGTRSQRVVQQPVKIGDVLLRKMKTFVKRMDMDHDGYITRKDLELQVDRYAELANLDPPQAKQALQQMQVAWDAALKLEEVDGKLDAEHMASATMKGERDMIVALKAILASFIFSMLDVEKTGFIGREQFRLFHQIFNLEDDNVTDECFDIIDKNKDGRVSFLEFIQAGVDFFLSNDIDSPYNVLFGPLVD